MPQEPTVHLTDGCPRLHPHAGAAVEDFDALKPLAHVNQEVVTRCLPGEACPTRSERDARLGGARRAQNRSNLSGVGRDDDRLRGEEEVRGVARVCNPVDRAPLDALAVAHGGSNQRVDAPIAGLDGRRLAWGQGLGHGHAGTIQLRIGVDCR